MKRYFKVQIIAPKMLYNGMVGDVIKVNWYDNGYKYVPESYLVNITGMDNLKKLGYQEKDILVRGLDKKGCTILVDAWDAEKV